MVLLTFGAGLGLSAASAQPYAGASAKAIAVISALYAAITMVAAFGAGGYVTGRMRLPATQELAEHEFRDGAHGFAVWALGIVIGGVIAISGVSGAFKTAVQATAAIGGAAAAGAASNPALGQAALSMTPTDYAIDRLMAPAPAAAPAGRRLPRLVLLRSRRRVPPVQPATGASRADVTAPMTRIFAASLKSGQLDARDRTMLVQTVHAADRPAPGGSREACRRCLCRAEGRRAEGPRCGRQGPQGGADHRFRGGGDLAAGLCGGLCRRHGRCEASRREHGGHVLRIDAASGNASL